MGMREKMAQALLRAREEAERESYRSEAQDTAAAKLMKVMGQTDDGMLICEDSSGREYHVQNSEGSNWATGTALTNERVGKAGWQVGGIGTHNFG